MNLYVRHLSKFARVAATLLICLSPMSAAVHGADFRIETSVFTDDAEEPISTTSTLFEQGVVYDFLSEPNQIAVFRPGSADKPGRFVLLDLDRKIRTELTTEKIDRLLGKLQAWSVGQQDAFIQFLATPKFDSTYNDETGELTLTAETMRYVVSTAPGDDPEAMATYRTFCDWYARLNAVTQSGMLPFPRLELNAQLDKLGRVPTQVVLTVPDRAINLRAEHVFTWRLSKVDRRRTDEARRHLHEFKLVDAAEFRKAESVAAAAR